MFQEITDPNMLDRIVAYGNLAGVNLDNMDIASISIDLEGVNFNNAYLRGANLEGINMFEAKLSGAHFEEAHLEGAELTSASINGAHFEGAYLNHAYLKGIRDFNNALF